ncbi:hypothetical protein BO226_04690 [Rhodococcus sp. 2G]|uniref:phage minor capsid protein n=1 Tax=Rhodococcus sp. 2G TaxID=1570939 RepID=UPI000903F356|nr:phage minor capsid protein [Rhodococcus sp. 2G]APE08605.1 hypothetical protein BO226_04690 [Rhodococcus sp. 2G]
MKNLLKKLWAWVNGVVATVPQPYSTLVDEIRDRLRDTINTGANDRGLTEQEYRDGLARAVREYQLWLQRAVAQTNRRTQLNTRRAFATLRAELHVSFPRKIETDFVNNVVQVNKRLNDPQRAQRLINQLVHGTWDLSTPQARQTAVRVILERAEREGFNLHVLDSAGRRIPIDVWVRRAVDGRAAQVALEGYRQRAKTEGVDLVKVSSHDGSCPKCSPWQGKTLSLNGTTAGYPTLTQAQAGGLFHISCRHGLTPITP